MVIKISKDGSAKWIFHRKAYRKARWRKLGQRCINRFNNIRKEVPEVYGTIYIKWKGRKNK